MLVIGGGPAGSLAARAAVEAGATVLLVEKKRRLGALPHCAEYVPRPLALEMNLPGRAPVQAVEGMETRLDEDLDGESPFTAGPGWIVDRQVFDHELAVAAAAAGARVWAAARLTGLRGERWLIRRAGREEEVLAGAVVAADGAASPTAGLMGWPRQRLLAGLNWEVPLRRPLSRTQVFLDPVYERGYAWLFPKGRAANLGLGCEAGAGPVRLLEGLRGRLVEAGVIGAGVLGVGGGAIPIGGMRDQLTRERVLLTGDAAGLTHPVSGAGIPQAVFSGVEAGRAAAALAGGATAAAEDYAHAVSLRYGGNLRRGLAARARQEAAWWDGDFAGLMRETWPAWSGGGGRRAR